MNESLLARICEENHEISNNFEADLKELFEADLVMVEPDGKGHYSATATDAGRKWNAANSLAKEPEVITEPVVWEEPTPGATEGAALGQHIAQQRNAPAWAVQPNPQPQPNAAPAWAINQTPQPTWAQPNPIVEPAAFSAAAAKIPMPQVYNQPHPDQTSPMTVGPESFYEKPPAYTPNPAIELVRLTPPPQKKRGVRKATGIGLYPFDTMEAGTAFYIPPSPEHPHPHKTLTNLITAANKKYAVAQLGENGQPLTELRAYNKTLRTESGDFKFNPDGTKQTMVVENMVPVLHYEKKFAIYEAKRVPNQPHVVGAYVFRME